MCNLHASRFLCDVNENKYKTDKTNAKHQLYTEQCRVVYDLIRNTKEAYYSLIIEAYHGNQQMLFQVINTLLHRKPLVLYPSASPDFALAKRRNRLLL